MSDDQPEMERLAETTGSFAARVASGSPTPGGGSVAAYCGELAASLGIMMCNLTLGKPKYADSEARVTAIKQELEKLAIVFRDLIDEDAASFESVLAAYRHPKKTDEERLERERLVQSALQRAARAPCHTAERSIETLRWLAEVARLGNKNAVCDVGTAAQIARASTRAAYYNVLINLSSLTDQEAAESMRSRVSGLIVEADHLSGQIEGIVLEQAS
jgi:formiminotetrahydrofolate cyclodeaminase